MLKNFLNSLYPHIDIFTSTLDFVSLAIILWGVCIVLGRFIYLELFHRDTAASQFSDLKKTIGIYLGIGIDFMIFADLVSMIEGRSHNKMITLVALVLVRIALYFTAYHEAKNSAPTTEKEKAESKKLSETYL
jgi:uncharacterized membrane protein